jgi:ascorbate-specific PTS system EIIC-type component UlaA
MKQAILNNWTLVRALRVIMGLVIIGEALQRHDVVSTIAGSVFTALGLFNIGCCGSRSCASPVKSTAGTTNDGSYEEVI